MNIKEIKNTGATWVKISVDRIVAPCEPQPIFGMECPICEKRENIMVDGIDMQEFIKRESVKHDYQFVLCPDCYDFLVEKIGEASEIYNS